MGSGKVPVYCHMTNHGVCGGGGWTLVMKLNGVKVSMTHRYPYKSPIIITISLM